MGVSGDMCAEADGMWVCRGVSWSSAAPSAQDVYIHNTEIPFWLELVSLWGNTNAKFILGSYGPTQNSSWWSWALYSQVSPQCPSSPFLKKAQNNHQTNIPQVCQCFCGPLLQPLPTAPGWALRGWPSWRTPCWCSKRDCSDAEL